MMNYSIPPRSVEDPLTQFDNLSKRVSKTQKRRVAAHEKPKTVYSPREEIYKSMIREIKSGDGSQMNSLVHKASGILRLSHYKELHKNRKVALSWDINGRKVLTYEDKAGKEKSLLHRQTSINRDSKKSLAATLNEPIFGLHSDNLKTISEYFNTDPNLKHNGATDGELSLSHNKVSKVWEDYIDTGDVSKLWQNKEGILSTDSRSAFQSSVMDWQQSSAGRITDESVCDDNEARPPWKTFYKATSSNTDISVRDPTSSLPEIQKSRVDQHKKSSTTYYHSKSKSRTSRTYSTISIPEEVERIQHICVVNGSVVSFKNFGFENFTNWFGDETALEANQRRCQPKLHQELDLTDVKSRDVKIRLLDGCKLEVDARRRLSSPSKPIRIKEILSIPARYKPEELLICRTKTGKLVVEEITSESVVPNKQRSSTRKSKAKRKTGKLNYV